MKPGRSRFFLQRSIVGGCLDLTTRRRALSESRKPAQTAPTALGFRASQGPVATVVVGGGNDSISPDDQAPEEVMERESRSLCAVIGSLLAAALLALLLAHLRDQTAQRPVPTVLPMARVR
jgi:hypothetical protein